MGYGSVEAQYLTIPGSPTTQPTLTIVYLWGAIVYFTVAWWSDRLRKRGIFLVLSSFITAIGYILLLATANIQKPGVLYFATYLVATGLYVGPGLNITYPPLPRLTDSRADGSGRMSLHITSAPRLLGFNRLWRIQQAWLLDRYTSRRKLRSILPAMQFLWDVLGWRILGTGL